jgi:hypothetical protein
MAGEDDDREGDEAQAYEGGAAAPPEGEQERSHESEETLSPDEVGAD